MVEMKKSNFDISVWCHTINLFSDSLDDMVMELLTERQVDYYKELYLSLCHVKDALNDLSSRMVFNSDFLKDNYLVSVDSCNSSDVQN